MNYRLAKAAKRLVVLALALCLCACGSPAARNSDTPPGAPASARPSPMPGSPGSEPAMPGGGLYAVWAASASQAWAVGGSCLAGCALAAAPALILRWDGAKWSQVASPSPGGPAWLRSVGPGPGRTAWAVGESCTSDCFTNSETDRTLIERWSGTKWSLVPGATTGGSSYLYGVTAGPRGTAWAVGDSCPSGCSINSVTNRTLILRWNGSRWSQMPSPSPGANDYLYSVAAGPGGTAWAVGSSCASGCGTGAETDRTLILRWDGSRWTQVTSPSPGRVTFLNSVASGPGGTAWTVGAACVSGCDTTSEVSRTLILRWDGTLWTQVPTPSPGGDAYLVATSIGPGGTAWAAGFTCRFCRKSVARTLIMRWNGTTWSEVTSPESPSYEFLNGVDAGPGGAVWAAGYMCASDCGTAAETDRALLLRWNGTRWSAR